MLILEGRKENVFNKYESQIRAGRKLVSNYLDNGSAYDFLVTDPFMIQSNYKYLDE
jgi:flagellar assembly factor FliW